VASRGPKLHETAERVNDVGAHIEARRSTLVPLRHRGIVVEKLNLGDPTRGINVE